MPKALARFVNATTGAVLGWLGLGNLHQLFDMISMLGFLILMGTVVSDPILISRCFSCARPAGALRASVGVARLG